MGIEYRNSAIYRSSVTYRGTAVVGFTDSLDARCFSALRNAAVAAEAGIDNLVWASTSASRIFKGLAGFLGGRNRGRLPFIEFQYDDVDFEQLSREGGTMVTSIKLRLHYASVDIGIASTTMLDILLACIANLRFEGKDSYMAAGGEESIGPIQPGPWGFQRDAEVVVEHTFDGTNYELA